MTSSPENLVLLLGTVVLTALFTLLALYLLVIRSLHRQLENHRTAASEREARLARFEQELLHKQELLQKAEQQSADDRQRLDQERDKLQRSMAECTALQARLDAERDSAAEKLQLLQQAREDMRQQFNELAGQVLEKNSQQFGKKQQDLLAAVISPFRAQLGEFRQRVDHLYDVESRDRASLLTEVQSLKILNQKITEEAANLTRALKGDRKAQGNWGEVILERVLEASGLEKGREYETQKHLQSESGERYQPDVIIHLPDNKDIVVDAKVSLSAYERYMSSEDEDTRAIAARQHVEAVRRHIDTLSKKKYDELKGINTLDFVFIFVPIEPAYLLAIQQDPNLFSDAFKDKIILASPTTLLATLRIVDNVWRFERQNKNAEEIARQAGKLYDKFVGFGQDLEMVGKRLVQAQESYQSAQNKLVSGRGNLVRSSEKLRELGVKTRKALDAQLLEESAPNNDSV